MKIVIQEQEKKVKSSTTSQKKRKRAADSRRQRQRNACATKIQGIVRCVLAREHVQILRRSIACLSIQSWLRRLLFQRRMLKLLHGDYKMASTNPMVQAAAVSKHLINFKAVSHSSAVAAAMTLQCWTRRLKATQEFQRRALALKWLEDEEISSDHGLFDKGEYTAEVNLDICRRGAVIAQMPCSFNTTADISLDDSDDESNAFASHASPGASESSNRHRVIKKGISFRSRALQALFRETNDKNEPVSAGLYLFTIQAGEFRQTRKMVLLK